MIPLRIAVLLGGTSEERNVSLATGRAVVQALRSLGHVVIPVDPAVGAIQLEDEGRYLGGAVGAEPPTLEELQAMGAASPGDALAGLPELTECDVVFLALHGGEGENGRIQEMLDAAGIRYTGSGVVGSAEAFDKRLSKELMVEAGIPTPAWTPCGAPATDVLATLGLPLVVKPSNGGSTVGLTIVRAADELPDAIRLAEKYDHDALCEEFVEGREVTVTVLGGEALPVVEIIPGNEIYDYESKYTPGMSTYICPADLSPSVAAELSRLAVACFEALHQESYSRIDFRLKDDGTAWCLEANSLPGMTSTSLVPKAAAAAGIEFPDLCERIVLAAVDAT
jgi:D-alanine-D-alanine ligase